mmetsp:Transcript_25261/g.31733  ORF Transcript_25261/g.31733 Transcript_25261/m.31733 type:complete len:303 (+) Transcript_25261:51-959(+)
MISLPSSVRLVAITSGGPRMHALKSQFERDETVWSHDIARKAFGETCEGTVDGFELEWIDGIAGEACRSRSRLETLAGDVLLNIGLSPAQLDVMGALCSKMRPGNRRVLGCLLANLRAMLRVVELEHALIIEDNVRVLRQGAFEQTAIALFEANAAEADLLYLGHLAHDDTMEIVAKSCENDKDITVLVTPPETQVTGINHELWGTFAYVISQRLLTAVLNAIKTDFPQRLFAERKRDVEVTPIDKLLQRVAHSYHFSIKVVRSPTFFSNASRFTVKNSYKVRYFIFTFNHTSAHSLWSFLG